MTDEKPDFTGNEPRVAATVLKGRYGVDVEIQHPEVVLKTNKQSDEIVFIPAGPVMHAGHKAQRTGSQ